MCGRLSQYTGLHEFVDALSMPNVLVNLVGEQPERYNVAPSTQVTTLRLEGDALVAQPIRWGWRPFWARDRRAAPINARVEKVAHGRFFSAAWRHRALCPVSGWFEWVAEGGPRKQPYHIQHADGSPILCAAIGQFPGLDDEQDERHGFVIITADSAGGMVDIHDRRPVVLLPTWPASGLTRRQHRSARSRSCSTRASRASRLPGTRSIQQLGTFEIKARIW